MGRAREGMALGNLSDGELEIGQAASQITAIRPASAILSEIVSDFHSTLS